MIHPILLRLRSLGVLISLPSVRWGGVLLAGSLMLGLLLSERGHRQQHAQERLALRAHHLGLELALAAAKAGDVQAAQRLLRQGHALAGDGAVLTIDDVTDGVRGPVHHAPGVPHVGPDWLTSAQVVPVRERLWEVRISLPMTAIMEDEPTHEFWLAAAFLGISVLSLLLWAVQRRNRRALARQNYAFLQTVVDSLPVPVFVKDDEHRYRLLNKAFGTAFNVDVAALIGQTDRALHDEATSQSRFEEDDHALTSGEIVVSTQADRDSRGRERHWLKSKARLTLPDGAAGLCGILTEVTSQRQAEAQARAALVTLEAILDALPQPLCVKNERLEWVMVNEAFARLMGRSKDQLRGTSDADYWDAETVERYRAHDGDALACAHTVAREECVPLPDGQTASLVTSKRGLTLPTGERRVIAVIFDVSELRESARKLEHAHQFLDAIVDALPHSLAIKDQPGHYLRVNRAWCEAVAIDARQVIGRKAADIFPADIASRLERQDAECWDTGGTVTVVQPRINLQGEKGWSLKSKRVVALPNGSRYNVQVTTDVTAQQEALRESQRSRELLMGILDSIPNPLIVKDVSRRYVLVNAAAGALGGANRMRVGGTDHDIFPAEIAARYAVEDDLALKDANPHWYSDHRQDASGAERWWVKSKRAITVAGSERLIVSVLSDVTALKMAERDLTRNQSRLRVLNDLSMLMLAEASLEALCQGACESLARGFEGARVSCFSVSDQSVIAALCSVGTAELPALTAGSQKREFARSLWVQLQHAEVLVPTDSDEDGWQDAWRSLVSGRSGRQALIIPMASGTRLAALLLVETDRETPWPLHEMRVAREAAHLLRIACQAQQTELARQSAESAQRASEAELRRHRDNLQALVEERTVELRVALRAVEAANQSKTQFFNNMSHELRTPMNAIVSFARLGLEKADQGILDPDTVRVFLQRIDRSAGRLLLLINDLLDLAKLEAGRMIYRFGVCDVRRIIDAVCEELSALAGKSLVRFVVRSEIDHARAWCDELRMEQVLRNVLSNALRYAPPGSQITMTLRPAMLAFGDERDPRLIPALEVVIVDEGPGIPAEELDLIFDEYVQGRRARAGGTGLGLPIAREILRQHGGSIHASNGPGGGAQMTITLPQTDPQGPASMDVESGPVLVTVPSET